jgi:hypothetical protein
MNRSPGPTSACGDAGWGNSYFASGAAQPPTSRGRKFARTGKLAETVVAFNAVAAVIPSLAGVRGQDTAHNTGSWGGVGHPWLAGRGCGVRRPRTTPGPAIRHSRSGLVWANPSLAGMGRMARPREATRRTSQNLALANGGQKRSRSAKGLVVRRVAGGQRRT